MAWHSPDAWPTRLLSGEPIAILIALVVTLTFPVLLHYFLYRTSAAPPAAPTILLLGPTGAGKTSLVTLLQKRLLPSSKLNSINGQATPPPPPPPATHTSQTLQCYSLRLPPSIPLGTNRYRSDNDTSVVSVRKSRGTPYTLLDTPGHGKLRPSISLTPSTILKPSLYGVIFLVDASAIASSSSSASESGTSYLTDAASYLHALLLALLRRRRSTKATRHLKKGDRTRSIPVLIAANKQDLFTAVPEGTVRERLETEIQRLIESRKKGVIGVDRTEDIGGSRSGGGGGRGAGGATTRNDSYDVDDDDDDDDLLLYGTAIPSPTEGDGGNTTSSSTQRAGKFSFKNLEDELGADLKIEVLGGSVKAEAESGSSSLLGGMEKESDDDEEEDEEGGDGGEAERESRGVAQHEELEGSAGGVRRWEEWVGMCL